MSHSAATTHRYEVHARDVGRHHARLFEEASFEAAAVAYLESCDLPAAASGDHEISIMVRDVETGRDHCFRVNLDSGATSPCG